MTEDIKNMELHKWLNHYMIRLDSLFVHVSGSTALSFFSGLQKQVHAASHNTIHFKRVDSESNHLLAIEWLTSRANQIWLFLAGKKRTDSENIPGFCSNRRLQNPETTPRDEGEEKNEERRAGNIITISVHSMILSDQSDSRTRQHCGVISINPPDAQTLK